jgi:GntR family transcriptional regulator/MocR family aminotransferase
MTEFRTSSSPAGDPLVTLDRDGGPALHVQLETALRAAIRDGRLLRGAQLPSTRRLAADLGLSRGVVVEAYQQLTAEGYLTSRGGGFTTVAADRAPPPPTPPAARSHPRIDLHYGRPDVSQFPRASWLRSIRQVLTSASHDRLNYLEGHGVPELRQALAHYLNRVRGTWAPADNVVVTSGFAQAWALIVQVLAESGVRTFAVEDPSFSDVRPIATGAGLEVVGIGVDDQGLDVDALAASAAEAVLVTPSHQLTGAVMSAARRSALVGWAVQRNAVVVEDDYDSEYRYDQPAIGSLQGLAPDHVVYAGSASKTLAPGLRLGWMVVPNRWVDAVAAAKLDADRGSPAIEQLAFADFLESGAFDRHLRTMRPVYQARRDALLAAVAEHLPQLRPVGISAGLHLMAWLPTGLDEQAVIEAAARRGLGINGMTPHRISPVATGSLILGFAKENERAIAEGVGLLADAIDETGRHSERE